MTRTIFISLPVTDLAASTSSGSMLSLAMDSRDAVDAMNRAAAAHGGQADANPAEDFGYMYSRDLADPDGHLWATFWMAPPAERDGGTPAAATFRDDERRSAASFSAEDFGDALTPELREQEERLRRQVQTRAD